MEARHRVLNFVFGVVDTFDCNARLHSRQNALRQRQSYTGSGSQEFEKHLYFLMLPGRFVPGRTFGILRSAMISSAIFDSPLQPTEKHADFRINRNPGLNI